MVCHHVQMNAYLSKSDFKVARTCPTKLYYKKKQYPTTLDDDPYMQLLADGGFMVGKLAQLQYPSGVMISDLDPEAAIAETSRLMAADSVVLFEAAFLWGGFLARVDILVKERGRIQLIEVKSKGYDRTAGLTKKAGDIRSEWVEYVEDIAFQKMVVQSVYPNKQIDCFLYLPDKAEATTVDLLPTRFRLKRQSRAVDVEFVGDHKDVERTNLLTLVPVNDPVAAVYRDVSRGAVELFRYLVDGLQKASPNPGYGCRDCEYRAETDSGGSGFKECWGEPAAQTPSILELYQLGRIKAAGGALLVDDLIARGKASLFDVPLASLTTSYATRQRVQLEFTKANAEWRSDQLTAVLDRLEYPLHFIDFETSRLVLPYHRGMRPFEQVAFQWSCHTLDGPSGELRHAEWINLEEGFPNVRFAEALRAHIGDCGTVLTWSHHEKTTFNDIARQMADYGVGDEQLKRWLLQTVNGGRLFDLCAHCLSHYFHPAMKGSTSIKAVLPAVWGSNASLRQHPWFVQYAKVQDGRVMSPYETLPALDIFDRAEVVDEGTGAMRAYQEMLYGVGRENMDARAAWRDLLLQYCKLDTLAMVMIWQHWTTPAARR